MNVKSIVSMTSTSLKMTLPTCSEIALTVAQATDIGGRRTNQDALGMAQQDGLACFVVADGAGGHQGGEVASGIVVQAVIDGFLRDLAFGSCALRAYLEQAIVKVAQGKAQHAAQADMSTTVAAVLIDLKNRSAIWAHMGDTRIYVFRDTRIFSITKDHSVVQQFVDAGYCKPEEARIHPQRSTLFAAIGAEGDTTPAMSEDPFLLEDGDALLICTDGFWEWISDTEMVQALASATDVHGWIDRMVGIAADNSRASAHPRDNFTAFTLWLGEHRRHTGASTNINDTASSESIQ
jgi:serine/threonine protein phosphatase PrpC